MESGSGLADGSRGCRHGGGPEEGVHDATFGNWSASYALSWKRRAFPAIWIPRVKESVKNSKYYRWDEMAVVGCYVIEFYLRCEATNIFLMEVLLGHTSKILTYIRTFVNYEILLR